MANRAEPKGHEQEHGNGYTCGVMMPRKREPSPKQKVYIPKPDIIPDRDAVDFWLKFFGYPALLTKKALESLIFRERQARDKKERECRTSSQ